MSSVQPNTTAARAKQRDPSADAQLHVVNAPGSRRIPLPEFYPTERTSTASFKAPVTTAAAAKKKLEAPPPPPGTLSTAMNYISSPVKYFSSMFTATPVPEPVKIKERQFKIDLEREKEKQASPRQSTSLKKVQNVVIEDAVPPPKAAPQQPEKNQGSAWRRLNMMDQGIHAPPSPKPAKFRAQSPKRLTPSMVPAVELSPTHVSQLTIASSSTQHSYKVMSKNPPEEPEKKKKKDPRKITNTRLPKETPVQTNLMKSNPKYNPTLPTKLNAPSPKDDYPIIPYPTVLPPRVPPPTYTIRSGNTAAPEHNEAAKEPELPVEPEPEDSGAGSALSVTTDNPELVSCLMPTLIEAFPIPGSGEASSVDDDQEPRLQETLGKVDIADVINVTRLDQLPSGRLAGAPGASSLRNLFHDAKLVNGYLDDVQNDPELRPSRVSPGDVVLCAASTKYSRPESVQRGSAGNAVVMKRPTNAREQSASPIRRATSPNLVRPDFKDQQHSSITPAATKDAGLKSQARESRGYSYQPPRRVSQWGESKANQNKEIAYRGHQAKVATSPSPKKVSPLKVDERHQAAVDETLGISPDRRRSRPSNTGKTTGSDDATSQRSKLTSALLTKPNIVKKTTTKSKDQSPVKSSSSSALNTAAVVAATSAATAAVSSVLQQAKDKDKPAQKAPEHAEPIPGGKHGPPRSPPTAYKVEKEGKITTRQTSPRPPSPKPMDEIAAKQAAESNTLPSPKKSLSATAKEIVTKKLFSAEKDMGPEVSTRDTAYKKGADANKSGEDTEEFNCVENYCGDPSKFFKAATMMGEIP